MHVHFSFGWLQVQVAGIDPICLGACYHANFFAVSLADAELFKPGQQLTISTEKFEVKNIDGEYVHEGQSMGVKLVYVIGLAVDDTVHDCFKNRLGRDLAVGETVEISQSAAAPVETSVRRSTAHLYNSARSRLLHGLLTVMTLYHAHT